MLTQVEIEQKLKEIQPVLTNKFGVRKIGYFGSYAMGNAHAGSDLDLLVEFERPIGWEFFTLEKYLEQVFGIPIDLVTHNAIKEQLKQPILSQVHYA
jgi:uncharacterized protein